jgi:hypothetical protein
MKDSQGVPSERQLAAELGMTHRALQKARDTGRVGTSKDVNVLRRELEANTDPRMQRSKVHTKATPTLQAHRARYEAARAHEKELKVKVFEGSLVDRAAAAALLYEAGKRTRESWEQ